MIFVAIIHLVTWQVGYNSVRVGEAAVPGPTGATAAGASPAGNNLKLLSINITSLWTQFAEVVGLPGDIVLLQETRLSTDAQRVMTDG